jgi:hypothetical protein
MRARYVHSLFINGKIMLIQAFCSFFSCRQGFATTADALRASLAAAKKKNPHLHPRAVVVINPGNPTGAIMTEKDMRDVVMFCKQEHLLLMADEVYQTNTWKSDRPFISFKKVLRDLGAAAEGTELISFHSVSKGFVGECGRRGGYFELINIDPQVAAQIYKIASISLCSNVEGQLMVGLMCNPPKKGDASFGTYVSERDGILNSLQRRGQKLATAMSKVWKLSCLILFAFIFGVLSMRFLISCRVFPARPSTARCICFRKSRCRTRRSLPPRKPTSSRMCSTAWSCWPPPVLCACRARALVRPRT